MEWLRDWIMQIAGIIVLSAACDMIMNEGEMKKYVKMVMGLVLVFAIVKPVVNISPDFPKFELPENTRTQAVELKNRLDEKEREEVLRIYRQKLAKSVENEVYTQWKIEAAAEIEVEEKDENRFGNIKSIAVEFSESPDAAEEEIKAYIGEKFDVNPKNVKVK